MPTFPETPITIHDLLNARKEARHVDPGEVSWVDEGLGMRARVGEKEMTVVVVDDPNFSVPFITTIRGTGYLVSPALM